MRLPMVSRVVTGTLVTLIFVQYLRLLREGFTVPSDKECGNTEEIEAHYRTSVYIKEICVLLRKNGIDDLSPELLHAVIVPDFDALRRRKIVNSKEVIRYDVDNLSIGLPAAKKLGSYEIWQDRLPRTAEGTLDRLAVKNAVGTRGMGAETSHQIQTRTPEEVAWLNRAEIRQALDALRSALPQVKEAQLDDNLELDLGLDSLQRIQLAVMLADAVGGKLEESRLCEIYTVREMIDAIPLRLGQKPAESSGTAWSSLLHATPVDRDLHELARKKAFTELIWFLLLRIVKLLSHIAFRIRVSGMEKLPVNGAFILCSNHQSYLDPVILGSLLPWRLFRNLFSVGTSEVFSTPFMKSLARSLRVVIVDPDANLLPAMRAGTYGLRHGRILILYPEGERSIDGTPKTFKKGAAILSIHTQAPIVPVSIEGFHQAWPRAKSFQRFVRLQVTFGDPIHLPPESEASEAAYEELTEKLREQVVKMWRDQIVDNKEIT